MLPGIIGNFLKKRLKNMKQQNHIRPPCSLTIHVIIKRCKCSSFTTGTVAVRW